jgi:hypothetical protein
VRSATAITLAVSVAGLIVIATTGCIWMLFDAFEKQLPPCDLQVVDDVPPYRPPDDVIWSWLGRNRSPAGPVYIGSSDNERVRGDLRQYQLNNPGASAIDYFSSLGMSCRSSAGESTCKRDLTVRYVCVPKQPTGAPDSALPQYEAILTVSARFHGTDPPRVSWGMVGKGGALWPPGRPPIVRKS